MTFRKNWNVTDIMRQLQLVMSECASHPDGFTACCCKRDLYQIKCFIEDNWNDLPEFPQQEREWEQERIIQRLKR